MSYVIIGNSTAAIAAIEGIRQYDKKTSATIISDESYHTYSRPLISYYLGGKVTQDKIYYRGKDFYVKNHVDTILGMKAESIDTDNREVILQNGNKVPYGKLLIATGGKPFIPPMQGLGKENIFNFIKLDDVKSIEKVAKKNAKAVVIGASFSGLKAVEALVHRGVNVTVIDIMSRIMPRVFDETASSIAMKMLEDYGVEVLLNTTAERILGEEKATGVQLKDGCVLPCDFVILAIGVRCNIDLVKDTKIKTNRGIIVDERMQTNIPGIYAAGDVAEGYNFIEDRMMEIAVIPNAYRQGETAGMNMAGGQRLYNSGFIMNSMPLLGLSVVSAGVSEEREGICTRILYKPEEESYRKFYIRNKKLVGYLLLNEIDRAGIYTDLIRNKTDITAFEDRIGEDGFGFAAFPKGMRKERMLG